MYWSCMVHAAGRVPEYDFLQIDVFVFERSPLHSDHPIVDPTPAPVRGELDTRVFQRSRPLGAGDLAALITVKVLRFAVSGQHFLQSFNAEVSFRAVGK